MRIMSAKRFQSFVAGRVTTVVGKLERPKEIERTRSWEQE